MAYQVVGDQSLQQGKEIELLNTKNEVLQLKQRVSDQKAQSSRLLMLQLVALVGSVGYWAFKIKREQESLRRMAEPDGVPGMCTRHHLTNTRKRLASGKRVVV